MPDTTEKDLAEKLAAALTAIESLLATVDGIATADAFRLGQLVREYGEAARTEAAYLASKPMFDLLENGIERLIKADKNKKPWE